MRKTSKQGGIAKRHADSDSTADADNPDGVLPDKTL